MRNSSRQKTAAAMTAQAQMSSSVMREAAAASAGGTPYIPSSEIDALAPEVRDYDPRPALDGGADGLEFFRRLAAQAVGRLKAAGKIMLEFGDGQAGRLREILVQHKWVVEAVEADYSGRPRILVARPVRV